MKVFTHPGLYNSGPAHWQTHWETEYGYERIQQTEWDKPNCADWIAHIDDVVTAANDKDVILIGHSSSCAAIVHWALKYKRIIKGALLVAPSDAEAPSYPAGTTGFAPMPVDRLLFPAIVIASSNDEYVTLPRAEQFAKDWNAEFVNAGAFGHINSTSNLGNWPFGHAYLGETHALTHLWTKIGCVLPVIT